MPPCAGGLHPQETGEEGPSNSWALKRPLAQGLDDRFNFAQGHTIDGFIGGALGHCPVVAINLPISGEVQVWGVQQSVHSFQWQSFAASFSKKPQDGVGCSHLASFTSFGCGDTYPATWRQDVRLAPFQGLLLCPQDGKAAFRLIC